ncbi:sensor histidine kinase [Marivirga harenae]|uniref:sensor histidine kinase n=1 Tax=Marivirga harenae TaxID=2010992 RepID=UPI0026DECF5D|nr:ATP-binding protein [Marivirga harenae]WKV12628.1 ATP-binding protein [Marivirga harenae]
MRDLLNLEIVTKTFDDLSHGVGIFHVEDLNDIKSIRYVFMNKIILYEMRKEKEEVFGKRIIEVAPEAYEHEGGLQVIETYRKVAAEGGNVNLGLVEYSNHMVAGKYECSVHHIQDNYVYVMLRNVTELEQTKIELEQKNEELSELTYIASHDLKEPVRNISSLIKLLTDENQDKLDEQSITTLSFISESAARMTRLINDLLDYSCIGGGGKELVTVDCKKLVAVIQQDIETILNDTNTTIELGELPKVKGFETELRLLFQNLISNSIKFRKPGVPPKITISAKEKNGWTFTIQDNGIGIPNEQKEKIFSIFQRLHSNSEYEGTGIGLAHCKKIVEMHKGKIWVDSKEGEGSTFYFTIPNL